MPSSTAHVATPRPARYLKQLAAHLGRRSNADVGDDRAEVRFDFGTLILAANGDVLTMTATADDAASLTRIEHVAGSHLERFGERDGLTVSWTTGTS